MPNLLQQHKVATVVCLIIVGLVSLAIFEVLSVVYGGSKVATPSISRQPVVRGSGPALNYVIMGDSTAVAQGADYQAGYAVATTDYLAGNHTVTMTNVAVSGARAQDVLADQLPQLQNQKPDVVLVAVGGNDVTHLTSSATVKNAVSDTFKGLVRLNCDVKIILTGVPQMGSVPRFPQPLRAVAGLRTTQLNKVFDQLTTEHNLTFARIAEETGRQFAQDPSLFAPDNFHPNDRGYAVWTPVLNRALTDALTKQPTHCAQD